MIRVVRHELGPRLYVMGVRLHECFVGLALIALAALALAPRVGYPFHLGLVLAALGAWMVIKDWRDFFPARRDTAPWRVGIHRPHLELREVRRGDWLPPVLGVLAAVAGAINVASVLSPEMHDRVADLKEVMPAGTMPVATALALPAGAALLIAGGYLARRRRNAWALATALLILLGALNLLKGLDIEEALLSWSLAGLLIWGREAFYVRHGAATLAAAARRVPLVLGAAFALALLTLWAVRSRMTPDLSWGRAVREAAGLLTLTGGPESFHHHVHWVPAALGIVGIGAMVVAAALIFRPLAVPRRAPGAGGRARARRLVRAHGRDTLSFFKLRGDAQYVFSPDGLAFLAYRIEGGVMLVSGDPVGDPAAVPGLLLEARTVAETHGLRLAVLAASQDVLDVAKRAGLRSLYLGDEAIVDVAGFSLEGRAIRKVRQSVTRLERAGYRLEISRQGDLPPGGLTELEAVSARWRNGQPERGFAMAMDALGGEGNDDCLLLVARDATGAARGFLHLVPCYGRSAVSLSFMRRDRDTPNGLTEFMVARGIEFLRERGIEELSLNFAAFGRWLRAPQGLAERAMGRFIAPLDRWFQIERLLRFNDKFFPRWEPRYLCFQGFLGLPRAALASLWAEGQLPRPRDLTPG